MNTLVRIALASVLLLSGASVALAQETTTASTSTATPKITFPIAELGNCDSKDACRTYCEQDANKSACLAYAQKVGLMSKEKVNAAKKLISKQGPGGCTSKDACIAYCKDTAHRDECLSFAKANNLISEEKATLIQKINAGEGPGACSSAESCKAYCEDTTHREECRAFAEANGLNKPKMGSTTPMMRRIGSSTMPMRDDRPRMGSTTREAVKGILASTTPGRERGEALREKFGSSTPGMKQGDGERRMMGSSTGTMPPREGMMQGKVRPMDGTGEGRPPRNNQEGSSGTDNLGATLLKGLLQLLGI